MSNEATSERSLERDSLVPVQTQQIPGMCSREQPLVVCMYIYIYIHPLEPTKRVFLLIFTLKNSSFTIPFPYPLPVTIVGNPFR